jgi:hypothetical protein
MSDKLQLVGAGMTDNLKLIKQSRGPHSLY